MNRNGPLVTTKSPNTFGLTPSTTSVENGHVYPRREIPDDNFLSPDLGVCLNNTAGFFKLVNESAKGGSLIVWYYSRIREKWQHLEIVHKRLQNDGTVVAEGN